MAYEVIAGPKVGVPFAHEYDADTGLQRPMMGGGGGGGGGDTTVNAPDREFITIDYRVKTAFTGAAVGEYVRSVEVWNVANTSATQVGSTVWRNITAGTVLGSAPSLANLEPANVSQEGLTNAQLRASAVPVSGPVTDTQLRATALPVSMASTPALTNTQLRATPVPVARGDGLPAYFDILPQVLTYTGSKLTSIAKTFDTTTWTQTFTYTGENLTGISAWVQS